MANESGNVPAPPVGKAAVKKSHLGLIAGAVVVLAVLWMMGAGGGHSGAAVSGATTETDPPAASGGNPLIGKWTLADPADASHCAITEEFTASTSKWTEDGKSYQMKPIYDIHPGGQKVTVGYGTSYMGDYTINGPDEITEGRVGPPPYSIPSFCKYRRM